MKAQTLAYICNHKDGHVKLFMEEPASPMWESSDLVLRHEAQAEIDALKAENAAIHAECDRLTALMHQPHDSTPAVDSAWNRFNEAISDGPDAPYPCMASAFESYYGQKWNDKGWRRETSVWAAAWKESANHLTAMLGPQKVLSAEEVTESGFYWHRYGTEEWCVVDVDFGYPYGRLFIWANGEQDDGLEGQFIGPIKMPEVSDA